MTRFNQISKRVKLAAISAVVLGVGILGFTRVTADVIRDCTPNSIKPCGSQSPDEFIDTIKNGDHGKHKDLATIFAASPFNLTSGDYTRFASTAVDGMANQDGTIVVDGQTVATDAWSIGRTHFSYATPFPIDGKTYYKSMNKQVLQQNLPVMVMFSDKGVMQFAVMKACDNPTHGHVDTPKYSCNMLHKKAVAGQANTYDFTTDASASDNAHIVKAVYDFGDGSSLVSTTSLTTPVRHTFTKAGTWKVRVTVFVSVPGNNVVPVTAANCETQVVVALPFQQCVSLDAVILDEQERKVQFTVTTNQGNGSVLKDASFNFGDGQSHMAVSPAGPNKVVDTHTYAQDGTFEASATVDFTTAQGVQSVSCTKQITISPQACLINPSVPANSPECKPCVFNNQIPSSSSACKPTITTTVAPTKLVNTGPGSVIGLFAGVSAIAGLGYHAFLKRRFARL